MSGWNAPDATTENSVAQDGILQKWRRPALCAGLRCSVECDQHQNGNKTSSTWLP